MNGIITNGNIVAVAAILCWPVCSIILYRIFPYSRATIWTVLGAFLFLPSYSALKVSMVPGLDKNSIASICAGAATLAGARVSQKKHKHFGLVETVAISLVLSPLATAVLNSDAIRVGEWFLPGVGVYDGISSVIGGILFFMPFLIGRTSLSRESDLLQILIALMIGGVIYSIPMLIEVRFSPQLASSIYGSFRFTGFATEMRYGGYRPVVFLQNGLETAFFCFTAIVASLALFRSRTRLTSISPSVVFPYLCVVLLLCKSAGSLLYTFALGPCVLFLRHRMQMRIAIVLASLALGYPMLRLADMIPTDKIVEVASTFDEERASSLKFRFDQEQLLLGHASERLFFGWGRYGRNRAYSEQGVDESTTDGMWIITLGQFGLIGFLAQFGLIAIPIFRLPRAWRHLNNTDKFTTSAIALILATTLVEQLPNASISSWTWLVAGSLLGRTEAISFERRASLPRSNSQAW